VASDNSVPRTKPTNVLTATLQLMVCTPSITRERWFGYTDLH
jgi:hypothetical protein